MIYPRIETKVVSAKPIRVSDDMEVSFEVASKIIAYIDSNKDLVRQLAEQKDTSRLKLHLIEWKFVLVHDEGKSVYPEIFLKSFKLVACSKQHVSRHAVVKDVTSDNDVKYIIH